MYDAGEWDDREQKQQKCNRPALPLCCTWQALLLRARLPAKPKCGFCILRSTPTYVLSTRHVRWTILELHKLDRFHSFRGKKVHIFARCSCQKMHSSTSWLKGLNFHHLESRTVQATVAWSLIFCRLASNLTSSTAAENGLSYVLSLPGFYSLLSFPMIGGHFWFYY